MHKVRGCLTALLAIVVLYLSWVAYPPSRYEAMSKEILQQSAERFQAEQKLAGNVAVNGYVDPVFLPYWGRGGMEYQKSFPLRARLQALKPYCDLLSDHDVGLESQKGPAVTALFDDYAKIYASFHENCNKPNFIVPQIPNGTYILPNVGAMRYLAFYNSAYAQYLIAKGRPALSLTVTADTIRFGARLSRQQSLPVYLRTSIEMQSIGQNTMAMTLENVPLKKLEPELEGVSKMLAETHPRRSYFLAGLEYEYYGFMNILADLQSHASDIPLLRLPGQTNRETRLFKNDYLAGIEALRSGRSAGRLPNFNLENWFTGRRGYLSSRWWISNVDLANREYMLMQKRQAFLHLWVELLRRGRADGRFPADFSQIVTLEGLEPKQIDYTILPGNQMRLEMTLSPNEVPQQYLSIDPSLKEWRLLMGTDWEVHGRL